MQWLDLVIVALVAWPTFSAFRAGLIRQVVPLVSLLVGGVVAGRLYARLAANLDFLVADEQLRSLTAFPAVPPLSRAISDSTLAPLFMQRLPLALVERFLPDEIHQALELFRRGVPPSTLPVIPAAKP